MGDLLDQDKHGNEGAIVSAGSHPTGRIDQDMYSVINGALRVGELTGE
jgi:hypothetical protein